METNVAAVAAAAVPYVAAVARAYGTVLVDRVEEAAADPSVGPGGRMLRALLGRRESTAAVTAAVVDVADDPADQDRLAALRLQIRKALTADPDLAEEIAGMVEQAATAVEWGEGPTRTRSVFLSHNRADRPFVQRIFQKLRKRGVRCWLDQAEILPGDSLIEKIAAGITEMDYLLCFVSEDSARSSWVRKEMSIALTLEIGGSRVRVVPALIGTVSDQQVPPAIADKYYLDFRPTAPFEKAMHELLMLLDEGYASQVSTLATALDEPDEFSAALVGVLMAAGEDVEGLDVLYRYYLIYKAMGLEIDKVFEMYEYRPDGAVERLARDLRRDIPYPFWDRLADADTLRKYLRALGKEV